MGVAVGIAAAATAPWIGTILAIARTVVRLAPQAGYTTLPSARTLLGAAGVAALRTIVSRTPDSPEVVEQARGMVEELVVDYMYPTAAERTVTISKILASQGLKAETPSKESAHGGR